MSPLEFCQRPGSPIVRRLLRTYVKARFQGLDPKWGYKNIATLEVGAADETITLTDPAHVCLEDPGLVASRVNTYELSYTVVNPAAEEGGVALENVLVRAASPEVTIDCPKTTLAPR